MRRRCRPIAAPWKDWTQRKGKTVDGRFVLERRDKHFGDFPAAKSPVSSS